MADLSSAQLQALRTDITVTRAGVVYQGQTLLQWWNSGDDGMLASFYNETASPAVPLWRPDVSTQDLIDSAVGTEYTTGTAGADVARRALFDMITRSPLVDATKAQVRANFSTAAGAASTTLTNWTAAARKNGTYLEALYAGAPTGGASVSPLYGQLCTMDNIIQARQA